MNIKDELKDIPNTTNKLSQAMSLSVMYRKPVVENDIIQASSIEKNLELYPIASQLIFQTYTQHL